MYEPSGQPAFINRPEVHAYFLVNSFEAGPLVSLAVGLDRLYKELGLIDDSMREWSLEEHRAQDLSP